MRYWIAFLSLISTAHAADQIKVVVCPPALNYCYYETKPVLDKLKGEDAVRAAEEIVRRNWEAIDRRNGWR